MLCQRLTTPHRNSANISRFFKFYVQHIGAGYLSGIEEDKQAEHLPPGRLPVWVEKSKEVTDVQVLEFIKENYLADSNLSVTVLHDRCFIATTADWCSEHGWRYLDEDNITGCASVHRSDE